MPNIERDEIQALFLAEINDPIFLEPIVNPLISPAGINYAEESLRQYFGSARERLDPCTYVQYVFSDYLPNHLVKQLRHLLSLPFDGVKLRFALTCPLSNELFVDPVVAEDGNTYERKFIQRYIKFHRGITPTGKHQVGDFYPNLAIKNFLSHASIQQIIAQCLTSEEIHYASLIAQLNAYIELRRLEEDYPWSFLFKLDSRHKIDIAQDFKLVLRNHLAVSVFLEKHQHDLHALTNGRLGKIASAEIKNLQQISTMRGNSNGN